MKVGLKRTENRQLLNFLKQTIRDSHQVRVITGFLESSGVTPLETELTNCAKRGLVQIISGTIPKGDPAVFKRLIKAGAYFRLSIGTGKNLHTKMFIFEKTHETVIVIGSLNLTGHGLSKNIELNVVLTSNTSVRIISKCLREFYKVWQNMKTLS